MSSFKTLRLHVFGHVQGVWFRSTAKENADRLNLAGWAQNEPDGSVIILIQGPHDLVDEFLKWCKEGSIRAEVKKIDIKEEPVAELFTGFKIRYL